MAQPHVTTGARSADTLSEIPRTVQTAEDHIRQVAARPSNSKARRFYSKHSNFRTLLWATPDRMVDGSLVVGSSKTAQFNDGWYIVPVPQEADYGDQEAYEAAKKEFDRTIRILESKDSYRDLKQGGSFWDADKMNEQGKKSAIEAARDQVRALLANPETAGMLREELSAEEFVYLGAETAEQATASE